MDASESLSCENNNSSLFSAVPDSSIMYQNKDSNLISNLSSILLIICGLVVHAQQLQLSQSGIPNNAVPFPGTAKKLH